MLLFKTPKQLYMDMTRYEPLIVQQIGSSLSLSINCFAGYSYDSCWEQELINDFMGLGADGVMV